VINGVVLFRFHRSWFICAWQYTTWTRAYNDGTGER